MPSRVCARASEAAVGAAAVYVEESPASACKAYYARSVRGRRRARVALVARARERGRHEMLSNAHAVPMFCMLRPRCCASAVCMQVARAWGVVGVCEV